MTSTTAPVRVPRRNLGGGIDILVAFIPAAGLFVAFLFLPLAAMTWRAIDSGEVQNNITSDFVLDAMRLSAITSTITLVLAVLLGTPLAYLLARKTFPGKILVDLLIDLPMVLPPTVAGVALLVAFGRRGTLGQHFDDWGIELAFTGTAVIMAQLFVAAPFYVRTVKAGFESVDPQFEGVASTLGAGSFRIFRTILLPLCWPSIVAGSILCWARALGELGATLIFAGNFQGRTQTMPLAIIGVFDAGRTINVAIALSVILVAAAGVLLILLRVLTRGSNRPLGL
ncbi:MAG: ABC transporter permease [Dehalococcoidia bacterium]